MKALSIMQPWAWAIVEGHKRVENRTWRTDFRGPLLVHAGQKFDDDGLEFLRGLLGPIVPAKPFFQRGGIVGEARLVACVTRHDSPFFFGPYGFVFIDAQPVEFRPCRGMLGFFEPVFDRADRSALPATSDRGQGRLL